MSPIKDHPLRYALANELHARPFPTLDAPCRAAYLAVKPAENAAGRDRAADVAHLKALRTELKRMVHECSGGRMGDCKVLEVLRDHSECLTEHEEIGA